MYACWRMRSGFPTDSDVRQPYWSGMQPKEGNNRNELWHADRVKFMQAWDSRCSTAGPGTRYAAEASQADRSQDFKMQQNQRVKQLQERLKNTRLKAAAATNASVARGAARQAASIQTSLHTESVKYYMYSKKQKSQRTQRLVFTSSEPQKFLPTGNLENSDDESEDDEFQQQEDIEEVDGSRPCLDDLLDQVCAAV